MKYSQYINEGKTAEQTFHSNFNEILKLQKIIMKKLQRDAAAFKKSPENWGAASSMGKVLMLYQEINEFLN
jgi:hypothetical protein